MKKKFASAFLVLTLQINISACGGYDVTPVNEIKPDQENSAEEKESGIIDDKASDETTLNNNESPKKDETKTDDDTDWILEYARIATSWERHRRTDESKTYSLINMNDNEVPNLLLKGTDGGSAVSEMYTHSEGIVSYVNDGYDYSTDKTVLAASNMSYEEMIKTLSSLHKELFSEKQEENDIWKTIYRDYLFDIMDGVVYLTDFYEAFTFKEANNCAFFALEDVTDDGIPELWITPNDGEYRSWDVIIIDNDFGIKSLFDGRIFFYDPDNNLFYGHEGGVFEHYTLYSIENGIAKKEYTLDEDDFEPTGYYRGDEKITKEQMDEYDEIYEQESQKCKKIEGIRIDKANIDKALGTEAANNSDFVYEEESLNNLLDNTGLFNGKTPRSLEYNWMWLKERDKVRGEDWVYIDPWGTENYGWLYRLKRADWDNDGIDEYYCQSSVYSGLYFDIEGDVLTALITGPYGMGWDDVIYYNNAYWMLSCSGNMAKAYVFEKYNGEKEIDESFTYIFEHDPDKEENSGDRYYRYEGYDYENKKEVSKEEFDKMCGENSEIYQKPTKSGFGKDDNMTRKLYRAIREFYEEDRPVLARY